MARTSGRQVLEWAENEIDGGGDVQPLQEGDWSGTTHEKLSTASSTEQGHPCKVQLCQCDTLSDNQKSQCDSHTSSPNPQNHPKIRPSYRAEVARVTLTTARTFHCKCEPR
jgi:hypothetical protein